MQTTTRPAAGAAELMTRREVAELFGVTIRHVDAMASRGELRRIKLGRVTRFAAADVRAIIRGTGIEASHGLAGSAKGAA